MNINDPDFNIENFQIDTHAGNNLLKINLRSDELPRYECANHKLDLAAKRAVKEHPELVEICSKLHNSNKHFRKVVKLSKIFRKKNVDLELRVKQDGQLFTYN